MPIIILHQNTGNVEPSISIFPNQYGFTRPLFSGPFGKWRSHSKVCGFYIRQTRVFDFVGIVLKRQVYNLNWHPATFRFHLNFEFPERDREIMEAANRGWAAQREANVPI